MAYHTNEQLKNIGFKHIGNNVKISDKVSIYNVDQIEIGDNSRIDDFCVVSGKIKIGRNVHITPQYLVEGGEKGIVFEDFTIIAYQVKVFTQSDNYNGGTMTNSTIPTKYKSEDKEEVILGKFSIVGAGSVIMPSVIKGLLYVIWCISQKSARYFDKLDKIGKLKHKAILFLQGKNNCL